MVKAVRFSYILVFVAFICSLAPSSLFPQTDTSQKDYHFTTDWFSGLEPLWAEVLHEYIGKPDVNYLEVGVYEGRSAIWMLENVLTHATAHMTAVDIFPDEREEIFIKNLETAGARDKVTVIKGFSQEELRKLPFNAYDIIYIDASHVAKDVFVDIAYSWYLLKEGGVLIFDDYLLNKSEPFALRPQISIEAFLTAFIHSIELIHRGRQVMVRKVQNPCHPEHDCTPIEEYLYLWNSKRLVQKKDLSEVSLSKTERRLFEKFLNSRQFGRIKYTPDQELINETEFHMLCHRLNFNMSRLLTENVLDLWQKGEEV